MKPDYYHSKASVKCGCGATVKTEKCKEKMMIRAYCPICGITTPWEKTLWDAAMSWEKQITSQGEIK